MIFFSIFIASLNVTISRFITESQNKYGKNVSNIHRSIEKKYKSTIKINLIGFYVFNDMICCTNTNRCFYGDIFNLTTF